MSLEIYIDLFSIDPEWESIHTSSWPVANSTLENDEAERITHA